MLLTSFFPSLQNAFYILTCFPVTWFVIPVVFDAAECKETFILCKMRNYELILVLRKDIGSLELLWPWIDNIQEAKWKPKENDVICSAHFAMYICMHVCIMYICMHVCMYVFKMCGFSYSSWYGNSWKAGTNGFLSWGLTQPLHWEMLSKCGAQ